MGPMPLINFNKLNEALNRAISAFHTEGNEQLDLQAHLVNLRLKELQEICRRLGHKYKSQDMGSQ